LAAQNGWKSVLDSGGPAHFDSEMEPWPLPSPRPRTLCRSRGAAADDVGRNRAQGGPDEEDGDGEGAGHLDDLAPRGRPALLPATGMCRLVHTVRPVLNLDLITRYRLSYSFVR